MGQYVKNEHTLGPVIHPRDQPIVVAMNVEHSTSTYNVRMGEVNADIG